MRLQEHPLHSGAYSLCFSLCTAWAGLACSPTDCAIGSLFASHCPLACLLMLAYACLPTVGSHMARSTVCLKIFPCLSAIRFHGAGNGLYGLSGIAACTHETAGPTAHPSRKSAMCPQAISGRFESDWHADGPFAQGTVQNALKRFKTGFFEWHATKKEKSPRSKELIERMVGGYISFEILKKNSC